LLISTKEGLSQLIIKSVSRNLSERSNRHNQNFAEVVRKEDMNFYRNTILEEIYCWQRTNYSNKISEIRLNKENY
jgi:hypothetical protein